MLEVTRITPRSFTLDYMDVFWEISQVAAPASSDLRDHEIFDYDFYVLRSVDSPAGPYSEISGALRDTYQFRDIQVGLLHRWRAFYYKIKVVYRPTGETKEFGPVAHNAAPPDLVALEVTRQEDILFREVAGRKCWLFTKRTFGPMCICYDVDLRRRSRSNHGPCFGTGYLGGYLGPIECYVQIDPCTTVSQATSMAEAQPFQTTARMVAYPSLHPGDVLVEAENKRWKVLSSHPTERLRATVRQELQLHMIPAGDVEYDLPVNIDISALAPASARNFATSTNIESAPAADSQAGGSVMSGQPSQQISQAQEADMDLLLRYSLIGGQ